MILVLRLSVDHLPPKPPTNGITHRRLPLLPPALPQPNNIRHLPPRLPRRLRVHHQPLLLQLPLRRRHTLQPLPQRSLRLGRQQRLRFRHQGRQVVFRRRRCWCW